MRDFITMKNKTIPQTFTHADIGAPVVFAGFDGGSYSATIVEVNTMNIAMRDQTVRVGYFPSGKTPVFATLARADWHRLTMFPQGSRGLRVSILAVQ